MRSYFTYIMASRSRVTYVGMTNNLERRVQEHKTNRFPHSFAARYNVVRLVYYEVYETAYDAIAREKEIKGWRRSKKWALIESMNPLWLDLSEEWED